MRASDRESGTISRVQHIMMKRINREIYCHFYITDFDRVVKYGEQYAEQNINMH